MANKKEDDGKKPPSVRLDNPYQTVEYRDYQHVPDKGADKRVVYKQGDQHLDQQQRGKKRDRYLRRRFAVIFMAASSRLFFRRPRAASRPFLIEKRPAALRRKTPEAGP